MKPSEEIKKYAEGKELAWLREHNPNDYVPKASAIIRITAQIEAITQCLDKIWDVLPKSKKQ